MPDTGHTGVGGGYSGVAGALPGGGEWGVGVEYQTNLLRLQP